MIEKQNFLALLALGLSGVIVVVPVQAQHAIDIQRKTAVGDHFGALIEYERMPLRRVTVDAQLAAARSAWGLGLHGRAIAEFDKALRNETLDGVEKGRIYLSRGIIEFQEGRYQVSNLYAEKAIDALPEGGPLRAKAWLLWGENLYRLQSYGSAEQKFLRAEQEAALDELAEVSYRLGLCRIRLGKLKEAKEDFQKIPAQHERSAETIRKLSEIALDEKDYAALHHWLTLGRSEFRDQFLDSWVDYALLQAAINSKDSAEVRKIRSEAMARYPASDPWFTLLDAAAEAYEWE